MPFSVSFLRPTKDGNYFVATKGAAEQTLKLCSHIVMSLNSDPNGVPLTADINRRVEALLNDMASHGLRTLGLAYKVLPAAEVDKMTQYEEAEKVRRRRKK